MLVISAMVDYDCGLANPRTSDDQSSGGGFWSDNAFICSRQVRNGYTTLAGDVLAAACLAAALCTMALPIETKGRALTVRACRPRLCTMHAYVSDGVHAAGGCHLS